MILVHNLEETLNTFLKTHLFPSDPGYHGLQVQGERRAPIKKIAFAVSVTQEIITKAHQLGCETLITHHGLYWKKQSPLACGVLGERLKILQSFSMNLLSYHLPLDCHPIVGNNAQIGQKLGLNDASPVPNVTPQGLLYTAPYQGDKSSLLEHLRDLHPHKCDIYDFSATQEYYKISWCSGSGGDFMEVSSTDIFITGDLSERHYTMAKENNICLVQAGHWQTETWGVRALATWVEKNLGIESLFIDEYNPI